MAFKPSGAVRFEPMEDPLILKSEAELEKYKDKLEGPLESQVMTVRDDELSVNHALQNYFHWHACDAGYAAVVITKTKKISKRWPAKWSTPLISFAYQRIHVDFYKRKEGVEPLKTGYPFHIR